eukprot:891059_1
MTAKSETILQFNPLRLENADRSHVLNENLFAINFTNVDKNDEKETKDKYKCIDLFKTVDNAHQAALWRLLTVGRKNNYPQLLLLLWSEYSRKRIRHFIDTNGESLSIEKWGRNSNALKTIISSPINSTIHNNIEQIIYSSVN